MRNQCTNFLLSKNDFEKSETMWYGKSIYISKCDWYSKMKFLKEIGW
jgi:hypothetical protein